MIRVIITVKMRTKIGNKIKIRKKINEDHLDRDIKIRNTDNNFKSRLPNGNLRFFNPGFQNNNFNFQLNQFSNKDNKPGNQSQNKSNEENKQSEEKQGGKRIQELRTPWIQTLVINIKIIEWENHCMLQFAGKKVIFNAFIGTL